MVREVNILGKTGNFFEKKKGTILNLLGSLGLLILAGGVGVFIALYQTYSPEKYMDDYYECFMNESYAALYKNSNVKESSFVNLGAFNQMMVNNYGYEEEDKYSISDVTRLGQFAQATVSFEDSETKEDIRWDLKLEKADSRYVFFNEWQVDMDKFIIDNVKLTAHKEVDIIIDDKNLTQEEIAGVIKNTDEETGIVTYIIDRMFAGDHTIMFVGTHTQPESAVVTFDEDDKFYAFRQGDLKTEEQESIAASVTAIVAEAYNSAFAQTGIETLLPLFAESADREHNLTVLYEGMLGRINQENGATLTSIDITNYSMAFGKYDYSNKITMKFFYDATYTAKKARVMADGVVIDGVRQDYEGDGEGQAEVSFEYRDGKWQAVSINMQCIDYSKENPPAEEEQ